MDGKIRLDYLKILVVGIPLLFMAWFFAFLVLAITTHDSYFTTYGAIIVVILLTPAYFFICKKFAKPLKVCITEEEYLVRNGKAKQVGKKTYLTKFDIWFAAIVVMCGVLSIFISQYYYDVTSDQITKFLKVTVPILIIIEIGIKKVFKI